MRDLQELFDAVDLAIGAGEGILPDDRLADAAADVRDVRNRRGHFGSTLVVALAGGTGSGKSSLLNAIAGSRVSSTSRIRPHTDHPVAWIPHGDEGAVDRLLDDLNVAEQDRHRHDVLEGVALIDLPDMDSSVPEHRRTVEDLLPKVDALIWVLDPEKYRDAEIHDGFLAPLAGYADQTRFVLNKADTLRSEDLPLVVDDLTAALVTSGYAEPTVFALAADPDGPPKDVQSLIDHLAGEIDRKRTAQGKLVADVASIVRRLGVDADVWTGASVRWTERWVRARDAALGELTPGAAVPSEGALCRLEDLVAAVAAEVDSVTADRLRSEGSAHKIRDAAVSAQRADTEVSAEVLDRELGDPLGDILRHRSRFAAALTYASVGARQLADRRGHLGW